MREIPTIYIGYDIRENDAYKVLKYSIKKHASGPVNIYPIKQEAGFDIDYKYKNAKNLLNITKTTFTQESTNF